MHEMKPAKNGVKKNSDSCYKMFFLYFRFFSIVVAQTYLPIIVKILQMIIVYDFVGFVTESETKETKWKIY